MHGELRHLLFTGPARHRSIASYIVDDRQVYLPHMHAILPLVGPC